MQVELSVVVPDCVEPRLAVHPASRRRRGIRREQLSQIPRALADYGAIAHHGPLAVADHLPTIEILAIEQRNEVRRQQRECEKQSTYRASHRVSIDRHMGEGIIFPSVSTTCNFEFRSVY